MGAPPITAASRARTNPINSWGQQRDALDVYTGQSLAWAFRGLKSDQWLLRTSLERLDAPPIYEAERYLVSTFQRRAHHYISDPPDIDDELEWLALMQHHGAPTRLLDWTKSPYVALFFAVRDATETAGNSALWAIDLDWCKNQALTQVNQQPAFATGAGGQPIHPDESLSKPELFRKVFLNEPTTSAGFTLVAPCSPSA